MDTKTIPYKTKVKVLINNEFTVYGEVVGLATVDQPVIGASHLIRCTDEYFPNTDYPYDTFTVPRTMIEIA